MTTDQNKGPPALKIFDSFCRFIDGLHMDGFVENDFMSKSEQSVNRQETLKKWGKP